MKNKSSIRIDNSQIEIDEDIKNLVLARIMASSDDLGVAIGSVEFTKNEIINSVKSQNKIGKEIMEIQMEYLRDMANGAIYQTSNE